MNFSLGKVLERYVAEQVEFGQFNNASEVVRDALRRQQEHFIKLEALRRDIDKAVNSVAKGRKSKPSAADIVSKARNRKG